MMSQAPKDFDIEEPDSSSKPDKVEFGGVVESWEPLPINLSRMRSNVALVEAKRQTDLSKVLSESSREVRDLRIKERGNIRLWLTAATLILWFVWSLVALLDFFLHGSYYIVITSIIPTLPVAYIMRFYFGKNEKD